eukprot:gnl/MRDRNA2_/MRDRNA2_81226_c0_seq2.p1 gnl/MRDRNA2_/MRDRNA2_81226_c0~~gnl/MRDRNA2_/MRDRNA2_81226_c0_seq2.p1  ORF type:complete len:166 (+),score=46.23 gnl/MRDRNA2_/MRDRNA2_81226_c0_seq2:116-613(+)
METQLADLHTSGFDYLQNVKQNRRSYLHFIFYLKLKDRVDYTGPEERIKCSLDDEDVTWMPLGTCRLMDRSGQEGESELAKVQATMTAKIQHVEAKLEQAKQQLKEDLNIIREVVEMEAGGDEAIKKKRAAAKRASVEKIKAKKFGLKRGRTQKLDLSSLNMDDE